MKYLLILLLSSCATKPPEEYVLDSKGGVLSKDAIKFLTASKRSGAPVRFMQKDERDGALGNAMLKEDSGMHRNYN